MILNSTCQLSTPGPSLNQLLSSTMTSYTSRPLHTVAPIEHEETRTQ